MLQQAVLRAHQRRFFAHAIVLIILSKPKGSLC
jgi:hypothetical protein